MACPAHLANSRNRPQRAGHDDFLVSRVRTLRALRRSEGVLGGYFLYVAALVLWRGRTWSHPGVLACLIPAGLLSIARADRGSAHRALSILRDWLPAALVLVAYWSVDWVPTAHLDHNLEQALVGW